MRAVVGPRLFEALYSSLAPFYDHVSKFFFAGQWSVWQQAALEWVQGEHVLELGYGTGDLLLEMCRRGYQPFGVDLSRRMHLIASRKLRRHSCAARLYIGSSIALPFGDERFEAVVSTFPSGYILDSRTWQEVHRVLRPGGRFIIVISNELLPVDHRSKLLVRFHNFVYGGRHGGSDLPPPARPGFKTSAHTWRNNRGRAYILVAEKRPAEDCRA